MDDLTFHPVTSKSGNIIEAAYDEQSETVLVHFNGGKIYEYGIGDDPIPFAMWNEWQQTFDDEDASTGTLFHQTIKKFPFRQVA